jgi:hypothetical protein
LFGSKAIIYLFANNFAEATFVLRLWTANSLADRIRGASGQSDPISPRGGRMGGLLHENSGSLSGSDKTAAVRYGDGVLVFRIDALSPTDYTQESLVEELRFGPCRGPHTLNRCGGRRSCSISTRTVLPVAGKFAPHPGTARQAQLGAERRVDLRISGNAAIEGRRDPRRLPGKCGWTSGFRANATSRSTPARILCLRKAFQRDADASCRPGFPPCPRLRALPRQGTSAAEIFEPAWSGRWRSWSRPA